MKKTHPLTKATVVFALALVTWRCGAPIVFEDEEKKGGITSNTGTNTGTSTATNTGTNTATNTGIGGGSGGTTLRIFLTATPTTGTLGGVAGADAKCQADTNVPDATKEYKALLVDATTRRACVTANCFGGTTEQIDWPLLPSTTYVRSDGTAIGTTTTVGLFTFPLTHSFGVGAAWTGLKPDWTSSTDLCTSWASADAAVNGVKSGSDAVDDKTLNSGVVENCASTALLYCVEVGDL